MRLVFPALLFSVSTFAQMNWMIDKAHTDIRFTVTHMMISEVDGEFRDFDAKVTSTSADFNGSLVDFTARAASINTDNERRDAHLKSPDFFDAEKYPEITFKGKISKEGDSYFLSGDFTIKGVTKSVKFPVKYTGSIDTGRGKKAGFKVTGTIKRQDYGVSWNSTLDNGGVVVSDEVQITCNVELNEVIPQAK